MRLSMQNYQAVFLTKINIGAFHILLQLILDQIKVRFTLINVATDSPGINSQKMALVLISPRITVS